MGNMRQFADNANGFTGQKSQSPAAAVGHCAAQLQRVIEHGLLIDFRYWHIGFRHNHSETKRARTKLIGEGSESYVR